MFHFPSALSIHTLCWFVSVADECVSAACCCCCCCFHLCFCFTNPCLTPGPGRMQPLDSKPGHLIHLIPFDPIPSPSTKCTSTHVTLFPCSQVCPHGNAIVAAATINLLHSSTTSSWLACLLALLFFTSPSSLYTSSSLLYHSHNPPAPIVLSLFFLCSANQLENAHLGVDWDTPGDFHNRI